MSDGHTVPWSSRGCRTVSDEPPGGIPAAEEMLQRVQGSLAFLDAGMKNLVEQHRQEVEQLLRELEELKARRFGAGTPSPECITLPNEAVQRPKSVEEEEEELKPSPPARKSSLVRQSSIAPPEQQQLGPAVTRQGSNPRQGSIFHPEKLPGHIEPPASPCRRGWEAEKDDKPAVDTVSSLTRPAGGNVKRNYREGVRKRMMMALAAAKPDAAGDGQTAMHPEPQGVLPDAQAMKERIRDAISKPEYNVANYYHTTGYCQAIARASWFEPVTLTVIAFNALWASIDIDFNGAALLSDADAIFQVAEHLFCTFFAGEWFIRFCAFKRKRDCFRDFWFVFDSVLAFFFVLDTWIFTILSAAMQLKNQISLGNTGVLRLFRLMRLNRMGRLVRIVRALPEMLVVIRGIAVAIRSVFFTLCLLAVILYVFGIAFRSLALGSRLEQEYFSSVPESMISLLLGGILPEYEDNVRNIGDASVFLGLVFGFFMFVATITLMNFLIGVLVEAVRSVSAAEKEQMTVKYVKSNLLELLENSGVDEDQNRHLSRSEFETMLMNPATAKAMQNMGVDVLGLVEFSETLFQDDQELPFADFIRLVLQLRGTNPTTVKDIVDLRHFVMQEMRDLEDALVQLITERVPKASGPANISRRCSRSISTLDKMLLPHSH
mmetsp:Transcript_17778/g.56314  ORF Transcript_17778/g.56314 Transcript_17778/m.56314 type:complete len:661 (+) Transcript_17778:92-2074(+)